jgi:predicted phage-related endonuclease
MTLPAEPPNYSDNLIVQLGVATEPLNRRWYEHTTGQVIKDVQSWVRHPVIRWMAATVDGIVEGTGAVFEAKFMLPWSFSEEAAAEKHMAQVQHNMWVANATDAVLPIIRDSARAQVRFNFSAISTRRRSASERDGRSG